MFIISLDYCVYTRSKCLIAKGCINTTSDSIESVKQMILGAYDNSYSINIKNLNSTQITI